MLLPLKRGAVGDLGSYWRMGGTPSNSDGQDIKTPSGGRRLWLSALSACSPPCPAAPRSGRQAGGQEAEPFSQTSLEASKGRFDREMKRKKPNQTTTK